MLRKPRTVHTGNNVTNDKSSPFPHPSLYLLESWSKIIWPVFQKDNINCKAFDSVDQNKIVWKILKEMGIPDQFTCLLRSLYAGQKATVRTGHGTKDWFKIEKGVHQGCIFSLCLFNSYAESIHFNKSVMSDSLQFHWALQASLFITKS